MHFYFSLKRVNPFFFRFTRLYLLYLLYLLQVNILIKKTLKTNRKLTYNYFLFLNLSFFSLLFINFLFFFLL
ncbi:hypothetical protein C1645_756276 [Glomus cerebriforme]|uniref:Uncharacterized protein n=1 Tax=Glomus cerebriforme TaxID=658196 RepID=A0A397TC98_9GLOM|nr:hypothetical protein C1645_756276 [Glomus cerebriforme]